MMAAVGTDAERWIFPAEQVVGFRGGRRLALVDNVVFREQTGDALRPVSTVHESFAPSEKTRKRFRRSSLKL